LSTFVGDLQDNMKKSRDMQKFRGHVTDFKTNRHMSLISDNMSLISMHIALNPVKKNHVYE
jgi:hypothetical protein